MFAILSFFFGASIGSFVQVIVSRLHVAPLLNVRSKCLSCNAPIKWYDLVPVLSHLVLRGKCRVCKSSFGIDSLFYEALFGAIFVCVYYLVLEGRGVGVSAFLWLLYYSVLAVLLGTITLYDIRHKIIPNGFFVAFGLFSLLTMIMRLFAGANPMDVFAILLVPLPFLVAYIVTKGKALGFGDILMYGAVGAFFGTLQGLAVLFISVWLGGIVGLTLHLINRKEYAMKKALPFVPFITIAFIVVLFTDIDIISIGKVVTWWYY